MTEKLTEPNSRVSLFDIKSSQFMEEVIRILFEGSGRDETMRDYFKVLVYPKNIVELKKAFFKIIELSGNIVLKNTSRDKAMVRLAALPKEILDGLAYSKLAISDKTFSVIEVVSDNCFSTELKLQLESFFLLTDINILFSDGIENIGDYKIIPTDIANSVFELSINYIEICRTCRHHHTFKSELTLINNSSCELFRHNIHSDMGFPMIELDSPKWTEPKWEIIVKIKKENTPLSKGNLKLILFGQEVISHEYKREQIEL